MERTSGRGADRKGSVAVILECFWVLAMERGEDEKGWNLELKGVGGLRSVVPGAHACKEQRM